MVSVICGEPRYSPRQTRRAPAVPRQFRSCAGTGFAQSCGDARVHPEAVAGSDALGATYDSKSEQTATPAAKRPILPRRLNQVFMRGWFPQFTVLRRRWETARGCFALRRKADWGSSLGPALMPLTLPILSLRTQERRLRQTGLATPQFVRNAVSGRSMLAKLASRIPCVDRRASSRFSAVSHRSGRLTLPRYTSD
jgi:hypothetical protein